MKFIHLPPHSTWKFPKQNHSWQLVWFFSPPDPAHGYLLDELKWALSQITVRQASRKWREVGKRKQRAFLAWISHKWRLNGAQGLGYHSFQMLIVLLKLIIVYSFSELYLLFLFNRSVVSNSFRFFFLFFFLSLFDSMDYVCPSLSPRVAQTHVHWVNDTTQPSHTLLPLLWLPCFSYMPHSTHPQSL